VIATTNIKMGKCLFSDPFALFFLSILPELESSILKFKIFAGFVSAQRSGTDPTRLRSIVWCPGSIGQQFFKVFIFLSRSSLSCSGPYEPSPCFCSIVTFDVPIYVIHMQTKSCSEQLWRTWVSFLEQVPVRWNLIDKKAWTRQQMFIKSSCWIVVIPA
jgi:hypothetical protein